ncbi:HAD-IIIA family hydrolase [Terricaulis sp.]|uniref:HAD-IIIA family hydrolase n=1 Tax=Terricaulis sp. TaxID=2768686 RepID=UPI00378427AC
MRQAVILVGGRGTRLGAHAKDIPKPLMPIAGDVRFLDYLIENIARHGLSEIVLLAGHLGAQIAARYQGRSIRGATLRVVLEPAPAGTAGALRYVADDLDDVFLMTNGDSLFDANYLALAQSLGADDIGAMALRRVPDAARFGRVECSGGRVTSFHEKDAAFRGEALISAGVYVLRKSVLERVGEPPCSIETDVFPQLATEGRLAGLESDGFFIDIGLPETLEEARVTLPAQLRRGAVFFDRDGTLTRDEGYTHKPEDLHWLPGAIAAIRRANDAGRLAIVITNQAGVARGLYSEADVHRFHAHMQAELAAHGAHIDAFYHCPHHGEGVRPGYVFADHPDRKPNPGMLRRALLEWPIDRSRSFMLGDAEHDVAAARKAGVAGYRVGAGEILSMVERGLSQAPAPQTQATPGEALRTRAATARAWLFDHALPLWWANGYDPAAHAFNEKLDANAAPIAGNRRVRVQARQVVVYARAGRLGWDGPWRDAVHAGLEVLRTRCFRPDGGTRHLLAPNGQPLDERRDLYDFAFTQLALAEAAFVLKDQTLLDEAGRHVAWLEANWAHPNGGFREGEVTPTPPRRQNPHMHLFEAFLALHEASSDSAYLARASAIAALFRDHFFDTQYGALREYFDDSWRPMSDETGRITEPGHQFEWSWLLHRWAGFGGGDLSAEAERLRVSGETYGVNPEDGAVYDEVFIEGVPHKRTSRLWPHTERIKANVARFELTRDPNAEIAAVQAFDTLMRYCDTPTPGLWRDRMNADGAFVDEPAPASSFYHIMFAMAELMRVAAATK